MSGILDIHYIKMKKQSQVFRNPQSSREKRQTEKQITVTQFDKHRKWKDACGTLGAHGRLISLGVARKSFGKEGGCWSFSHRAEETKGILSDRHLPGHQGTLSAWASSLGEDLNLGVSSPFFGTVSTQRI